MNETLADGLTLMVIGMGTVLLFLCLMIVSMTIMSKVVIWLNKIFPEAVPQLATAKKTAAGSDEEVAVAILAAMFKK